MTDTQIVQTLHLRDAAVQQLTETLQIRTRDYRKEKKRRIALEAKLKQLESQLVDATDATDALRPTRPLTARRDLMYDSGTVQVKKSVLRLRTTSGTTACGMSAFCE